MLQRRLRTGGISADSGEYRWRTYGSRVNSRDLTAISTSASLREHPISEIETLLKNSIHLAQAIATAARSAT